jgi:hypothetical protein
VIGQLSFFSRVLFGRTEIAPKSHGRVKRQYKSGDARNDVRALLLLITSFYRKDSTLRRNVCGYVVTNVKNVVFKPIIMVEITDSRILQRLEN